MNLTLSIDDRIVAQARRKASETGTTLNQYVRDRLAEFVGEDDAQAKIARLRALSGKGDSRGWKWNREEIYEERFGRHGNS